MSKLNRWIVFCAMVGLSGCATMHRPVPCGDDARQAAAVTTRWIGMTRAARRPCPVPASLGWTVRPLFPLRGLEPSLQRAARQAELDRFCVYEYNGSDFRPELPREVLDQLSAAEPDKVALTTSAVPALDAVTRDPFQQRFFEQVQVPTTLPEAASPPVRLAFLDTQPTANGVPLAQAPRRSEHGHTLIQIAGHLASGQVRDARRPLPIGIASQLAMPLVRFDPVRGRELERDEAAGGVRGTFADLTAALWQEIVWWDRQPEPRRLVLNLSLGWDGEKFGGWEKRPADMTPEVRAVYQVLEVAACEGILVIAAAGNERPGPGATERPLLPAGWESRGPGRRGRCHAQPLVYAVSGVDGRDHPLVNTRAQGEASRVAYADHVVVPNLDQPTRPTATLTGTSVAAAVVSTTAALVWQYHPELNAAQVMALLSQSGKILPRRPDFSAPSTSPQEPVRRIALCPALLKAGVPGSFGCPLPPPPPLLKDELSILRPDRKIQMSPLPTALPISKPRNVNDQVAIGPQPGENPCPNCAVTGPPDQIGAVLEIPAFQQATGFARASFKPLPDPKESARERDYRLLIEIPSVWPASLLRDAILEVFVFDLAGRKQRLGPGCRISPLGSPGETLEVTRCFEGIEMGTPFQASLSFVMAPEDGGPDYSIESPLFVEY